MPGIHALARLGLAEPLREHINLIPLLWCKTLKTCSSVCLEVFFPSSALEKKRNEKKVIEQPQNERSQNVGKKTNSQSLVLSGL
jgi:hypothetical protein